MEVTPQADERRLTRTEPPEWRWGGTTLARNLTGKARILSVHCHSVQVGPPGDFKAPGPPLLDEGVYPTVR